MAHETPTLIDGYTYVQALRQGAAPAREFRPRRAPARPPGAPTLKPAAAPPAGPAQHIGHSVLPACFEIICYDCGYAYSMQGRIYKALCPKCRKFLDPTDYTIDGAWNTEVRTIGTVTIAAGGVVSGVEITATDIVLEGDARAGRLRAMRRLEIRPGAQFDLGRVRLQDLLVEAGALFAPTQPLVCRHVEVRGRLHADLRATGRVTVRCGGLLAGTLQGAHLSVEDGAGLRAQICVRGSTEGTASQAAALASAA